MTTTTINYEAVIEEAKEAAGEAYWNHEAVNPQICGFASAKMKLDARTKVGKELVRLGFKDDYCGNHRFSFYDMVASSTQSVEFKEAAVEAFVQVLKSYGINAYVWSKLD